MVVFLSRVIGIVSGKGGVGKTTIAINLGVALSQRFRKNVTLVDCNVTTSHIGLSVGIHNPHATLNGVLRGESEIEEAVHQHFTGLRIIPASIFLRELDRVDITKLRENIEKIFHKNDIIILDAGPGLGREAMAAIKASDEILYVGMPYMPSVIDIIRCNEAVSEVGAKPIGIVMNMKTRDRHEMTKHEVEYSTSMPVISTVPYDKHVRRSLSAKMPVVIYKPRAAASKEIFRLSSAIAGMPFWDERNSFLSRIKFW